MGVVPQPAKSKHAAIYCRVSSADQATEDKVSLSEQLADCETYCASQGYEVVDRYRDVMSGSTSKRPDFQRLIKALEDALEHRTPPPFEVIVCWKVDRLGRGLYPMARLLEPCERAGVVIEAVKEKVDQRFLGLFAGIGKIELDNIRERTTSMRRAYARQGKVMNSAVRYGYRVTDTNEPAIDEAESAVLLDIAQRYAAGEPLVAICRDLRARQVPTRAPERCRHGISWPEAYVAKILADEAYRTGLRTFGGETVPYPPIFSAELWEAVKARRAMNAYRAKRNTKVDFLLQHLLWCRCCKLRFTARTQRFQYSQLRKDGTRKRYDRKVPRRTYACIGALEYGEAHSCRRPVHLEADWLEKAVWGRLTEALDQPDTLLAGIRGRLLELEAQEHDGVDSSADRELAALKLQRLEIVRQRARGKIDDATMDLLTGELDVHATYLEERADAAHRLRADIDAQRRVLEAAGSYLEALRARVAKRLDELTFAERRELLEALVDRVWIDAENRIEIDGVLGAALPEGNHQVNCSTALSRASM